MANPLDSISGDLRIQSSCGTHWKIFLAFSTIDTVLEVDERPEYKKKHSVIMLVQIDSPRSSKHGKNQSRNRGSQSHN
jgi:hypothetical protein